MWFFQVTMSCDNTDAAQFETSIGSEKLVFYADKSNKTTTAAICLDTFPWIRK